MDVPAPGSPERLLFVRQEYADCLPAEVARDPAGRLGAWLYSCVGVSHAEEAALQGLPGLTLQASCA
jgi:hypothetical protein